MEVVTLTNQPSGKRGFIQPAIIIFLLAKWSYGGFPTHDLEVLHISVTEANEIVQYYIARGYINSYSETKQSHILIPTSSILTRHMITEKLIGTLTNKGLEFLEDNENNILSWFERWVRYCQK